MGSPDRKYKREDKHTSSERRRDRHSHKSANRKRQRSPDEDSSFKPLFFKGTAGAKIAPAVASERPKKIQRKLTPEK